MAGLRSLPAFKSELCGPEAALRLMYGKFAEFTNIPYKPRELHPKIRTIAHMQPTWDTKAALDS